MKEPIVVANLPSITSTRLKHRESGRWAEVKFQDATGAIQVLDSKSQSMTRAKTVVHPPQGDAYVHHGHVIFQLLAKGWKIVSEDRVLADERIEVFVPKHPLNAGILFPQDRLLRQKLDTWERFVDSNIFYEKSDCDEQSDTHHICFMQEELNALLVTRLYALFKLHGQLSMKFGSNYRLDPKSLFRPHLVQPELLTDRQVELLAKHGIAIEPSSLNLSPLEHFVGF